MADREDEDAAPEEPVQHEPPPAPLDDDAVWAALIAGFDVEPEPGTGAWPEAENLPAKAPSDGAGAGAEDAAATDTDPDSGDTDTDAEGADDAGRVPKPPGSTRSIVVHPVIHGPRDYVAADDEDDGHFVPPEPPPLPEADVTTKFAWLAVLGGPLLLLAFILFQLELTWWATTLGVGGFVGGFATLVARMRTGEDDDDLPGGGAVV